MSRLGQPASHAMRDVLEAATLLQHWDRPSEQPVHIPRHVMSEAYQLYTARASRSTATHPTRAGVPVDFDLSPAACARAVRDKIEGGLLPGDRINCARGDGTIVGAHRGHLWYVVDTDPQAWYFEAEELSKAVAQEKVKVLKRVPRVRAVPSRTRTVARGVLAWLPTWLTDCLGVGAGVRLTPGG